MTSFFKSPFILIAEDDEEDCELLQAALIESRIGGNIFFVHDGVELMEFLNKDGKFKGQPLSNKPDLILLDLNMPRKTGGEVLSELKSHPFYKSIPVVVFTTSQSHEDIISSYDRGANSYISKPGSFPDLVTLTKDFQKYWFSLVKLPY